MRLNRIDVKLGLTMITVFLLVFAPFVYVIDQVFCNYYYNKAKEEARQLTSNYAQMIANNQMLMSTPMVEMAGNITQKIIFLLDKDGDMIMFTGTDDLEINIKEFDLQNLFEGRPVFYEYVEPLTDNPYLLYGHPINADQFKGSLFMLFPLNDMYDSMSKVRQLFLLAGVGGFFLALGFTFIASRKLSSPLLEMQAATKKIAKGDLNTKVIVRSKDEIGSLAVGINNLTQELKRHHDTRSEFFASISHELKTPVSYLMGYSEVLKEKLYQTEEEKEQYLSILEHEATRLNSLISELFDLSKMEEGKFEIKKEWIDLTELADNLDMKYLLKAKEKGLSFIFKVDENISLFYGDGKRIEQILTNLLDNAFRHTTNGQVTCEFKQGENQVFVIVKDTGTGIPADEVPFIFERFYRVEKSRSREFGGTGLGLAIVKMLVKLHGGTIEVTSKENEGTQFTLSFPNEFLKKERGEQI
ncbi:MULTISPECIES: sensor histidine kinase [Bacillaceae]|uniref:histidine kinase n=1 Tax=Halalkalibacter alkaliphilus TaxID=2917993 RepID=A0A9X2CS87_9BACI|nr:MULTISPECIES: HAMP domain-containing sensor histidine kinase [Bacillaceae]MCL7747300.1 HAMP domain-containing histidine kinase [Halalkalibacter alkaliphilus]MDT8860522.1 HAMP domain-containing histidine kinase [Alkalihalobacillus sp. MEB130]